MLVMNRTLLFFIVSALGFLICSCGGPPKPAVRYGPEKYISLEEFFQADFADLSPDEILPIEMVEGKLCVVKPEFRPYRRSQANLYYCGLIFQIEGSSSSAYDIHRLQTVSDGYGLVSTVTQIEAMLSARPTPMKGLAVLIDSVRTLADDQLAVLAGAPLVCLMINGPQYLYPRQTEILAGFGGKSLSLDGLLWIGEEQARALTRFGGEYLSVNSIRHIDARTMQVLCRFEGAQLGMNSLNDASVELFEKCTTEQQAELVTHNE